VVPGRGPPPHSPEYPGGRRFPSVGNF